VLQERGLNPRPVFGGLRAAEFASESCAPRLSVVGVEEKSTGERELCGEAAPRCGSKGC